MSKGLLMDQEYVYDIAISYRGLDRPDVELLERELKAFSPGRSRVPGQEIIVMMAKPEEGPFLGEHLETRLDEIYRKSSRFVVAFPSKAYFESPWCVGELNDSLTRWRIRSEELKGTGRQAHYLIPIELDGGPAPGDIGYETYKVLRDSGITGFDWRAGDRRSLAAIQAEEIRLMVGNLRPKRGLDAFVGRRAEIEECGRSLDTQCVIRLLGQGGSGKTRLAIALALQRWDQFRHGAWFIALESIRDKAKKERLAAVLNVIGATIGISKSRNEDSLSLDTVVAYFAGKTALLVLDNCETCSNEIAIVVTRLCESYPNIKIICTSQKPINIPAGTDFNVHEMTLPQSSDEAEVESADASQLFLVRARARGGGVDLSADDYQAVRGIVGQLNGIPLAIELAAGWTSQGKSIPWIAAHMDDQLKILVKSYRFQTKRQATMRAALDWTYNLLESEDQVLFRRLAIFAPGFKKEAVQEICGDSERLERLVSQFLVRLHEDGDRYSLQEVVRQYALEKVSRDVDYDALREKHLHHYLSVARKSESELYTREQAELFAEDFKNLPNYRLAIEFAREDSRRIRPGLELCSALWLFSQVRNLQQEQARNLEALLPQYKPRDVVKAEALDVYGQMLHWSGDEQSALKALHQAVRLGRSLNDSRALASALVSRGLVRWAQGYADLTKRDGLEALEVAQKGQDEDQIVAAKSIVAWAEYGLARFTKTIEIVDEILPWQIEVNDGQGIADSENLLGLAYVELKKHAEAERHFKSSLEIYSKQDDHLSMSYVLWNMGYGYLRAGDYVQCYKGFHDCFFMDEEFWDGGVDALSYEYFAILAVLVGKFELAGEMEFAAQEIRERDKSKMKRFEKVYYEAMTAAARQGEAAQRFAKGMADKSRRRKDEVRIKYALAELEPFFGKHC